MNRTTKLPRGSAVPNGVPRLIRPVKKRVGVLLDLLTRHTRQIATSVARYASEKGDWSVVIARADDKTIILGGYGEEDLQSLDGVIAGLPNPHDPWKCPAVFTSTPWGEMRGPVVTEDNEAIGRSAASHLGSLGMPFFGFVGMRHVPFSELRLAGFETALKRDGQSVQKLLFKGWLEAQHGVNEIAEWLGALQLPCAVLAVDDRVAATVSMAAQRAGLHVPEQIAILGVHDDDICCAAVTPALSSIPIPGSDIGYEAARRLDLLMSGQKVEPLFMFPPGEVVQRGSTQVLGYEDLLVCEAMRLVRTRGIREPVVVDQIANDLGVHRQQLNRSFARHVGRSPKEEIDRVRGERLKSLLTGTDMPIKQIAYDMGFASPSQLIRFCRRMFEKAPLQIRSAESDS